MKIKELPYFHINGYFGGNQDWMRDPWMRIGGCGALTMCDLMIYMAAFKDYPECYPYDINNLTKHDYRQFGKLMAPYLHPRQTGIKDLQTFIDGAKHFLDYSELHGFEMTAFDGNRPVEEAKAAICESIDQGMPVPMLMLKHADKKFNFFEWHWFPIVGYKFDDEAQDSDEFQIKVATYGKEHWLPLDSFWDTGRDEKGGLVLVTYEK